MLKKRNVCIFYLFFSKGVSGPCSELLFVVPEFQCFEPGVIVEFIAVCSFIRHIEGVWSRGLCCVSVGSLDARLNYICFRAKVV